MITFSLVIICTVIFATIFGIYGQDIAYYLESFTRIDRLYLLTTITILSYFLYLISIILLVVLFKKYKKNYLYKYLVFTILLAFMISFWSFFVMCMWWG